MGEQGVFGWVPPAGNPNAAPTMLITYRLDGVEVKDLDSGLRPLCDRGYRLGVRLLRLGAPICSVLPLLATSFSRTA